jgi:hypothetical protein
MATSRNEYAALDALLTGYLIDSVANYCGSNIKGLGTLNLRGDFFTQIATVDNENIEQYLAKEFSKLDRGWFHMNKHKNLAKKLAKYVCEIRKNLNPGHPNHFSFNPGNRIFSYKLYLACKNTNAELNYFNTEYLHGFTTHDEEPFHAAEPANLTKQKKTKSDASTAGLTSESLAKKIRDDLLKPFKARLEQMKSWDLVSELVTEKFNLAIGGINTLVDTIPIQSTKKFDVAAENVAKRSDATAHLNTTSLVTALEEIEKAIKNNYGRFATYNNDDKERLKEIKTMRSRLSKDSFIWTLTVRLSPTALTPDEGHGYADAKEGLKSALKTIADQKKTKNNTENHDAQADKKQSATPKRSSWGIVNALWRTENSTKASYSAVAKSDDGNRSTTSQASTFFSDSTFPPKNNKKFKIPNASKFFKRLLASTNNPPKRNDQQTNRAAI